MLTGALADVEAADDAYFAALGPYRGNFLAGLAALSVRDAESLAGRS